MGITTEFTLNTGESRVVHLLLEHYHWTGLDRLGDNRGGNKLLCDLFAFEIEKSHRVDCGYNEFSYVVASYMYKNLVKHGVVEKLKPGEKVLHVTFAC